MLCWTRRAPGGRGKFSDSQIDRVLQLTLEIPRPIPPTGARARWPSAVDKTAAIKRWLLRHPRFHLHFTPTGGSWLNLVERRFALLTEKQLRRGVHRSTRELQDAIRAYLDHHNRHLKPFKWTKTADQILESVARFRKRICNSGH
jgi:hypothetical protein